jgi:hypothetical protein
MALGRISSVVVIAMLAEICVRGQAPSSLGMGLIVLEGASDVTGPLRGTLSYKLVEPYPATAAIQRLTAALSLAGWVQLDVSLVDTSKPPAHLSGWQHYIDARAEPRQRVHRWTGDWGNGKGDAVTYVLTYRGPPDRLDHPSSERLEVVAGFVSAPALAKEGIVLPRRPGLW